MHLNKLSTQKGSVSTVIARLIATASVTIVNGGSSLSRFLMPTARTRAGLTGKFSLPFEGHVLINLAIHCHWLSFSTVWVHFIDDGIVHVVLLVGTPGAVANCESVHGLWGYAQCGGRLGNWMGNARYVLHSKAL